MIDVKKIQIKIHRLVDSLFVGNYKTAFKWRGIEFSDFRLYDEWDDVSLIDFWASAREWKLLIKRSTEERELSVFFFIDISSSMFFQYWEKSKIQTLIETFYTLWLSAIKNNDKVWAFIYDENSYVFLKPQKWLSHLLHILSFIQDKQYFIQSTYKKSYISFDYILSFFFSLPYKNGLVVLLNDSFHIRENKNFKILPLKHEVLYIHIFDSFENNLSTENAVSRFRYRNQRFFFTGIYKQKILEYQNLRNNKIKSYSNKLHLLWVSYLVIDNTSNIFWKLLWFFKTK